jgi:hypothetical protein
MVKRTEAECRGCGDVVACDNQTITEVERVSHDEGRADVDVTVTTGQCDSCLESSGPDEHFRADEEQDEAYARAEAEYRGLDRGEL